MRHHKTHLQNLKIKRRMLKHIYQENVCPKAQKIIFRVFLLEGFYFIYYLLLKGLCFILVHI